MGRRKEKGKSKAKGSAKSTPRRVLQASSKRQSSHSWPVQEATVSKFSLADEARWQANHRTAAFDAAKKLRELPIQFVSAGYLEGTIKECPPVIEAAKSDSESSAASSPATSSSSLNNTQAMAHMAIRSPSPSPSEASSSADEVVFRGRGQIPPATVATSSSLPVPEDATDAANLVATDDDTSAPSLLQTTSQVTSRASGTLQQEHTSVDTPQLTAASTDDQTFATAEIGTHVQVNIRLPLAHSVDEDVDSDADSVVDEGFEKRRGGRPAWEGTTTAWEHRSMPGIGWARLHERPDMESFIRGDVNPRNAAMDDYMQNMDDFGLADNMQAASAFSQREMDLDGSNHNDWQPESSNQGEDRIEETDNDSWSSAMLKDFDDLSTSSDVMDTVGRILSKRTAKSGVHYLCVYESSVTDDARWLPAAFLTRPADKQLIQAFEEKLRLRQLQQLDGSSSESLDEDSDKVDDEAMARRLQKQEELGLGSDELLLYGRDDIYIAPAGVNPPFDFGRPNKKRQARVRGRQQDSYPSASALADAVDMDPYGAFDIMDTERPSLRPRKKGRRGQMPPELEDSDLNEQLQNAWENDRAKKRLKKAEREELRQQGLIGRKGKYQGAATLEDVVEDIREFLSSERMTMSLPPMDAHHRATVHQAAEQFNLTSRSQGAGQDRFIVLFKTGRTRTWSDDEFNILIQRRRFFKRLRGPLNSVPVAKKAKAAVRPRLGYKDGDTVGANAPELGPENKGHALMEKMGWSKGMALGAVDNKGILQPIPHLVKTNKAGLK